MRSVQCERYPLLAARAAENGCDLSEVRVTVPVYPPTNRRGLTQVTLRPGVHDEDAEEFFGYRACGLLAGAMHEVSAWPYAVLEALDAASGWVFRHAGVLSPAGMFVDLGPAPVPQALIVSANEDYWGCPVRLRALELRQWFSCQRALGYSTADGVRWWRNHCEPETAEVIEFFARKLLAQAGFRCAGDAETMPVRR